MHSSTWTHIRRFSSFGAVALFAVTSLLLFPSSVVSVTHRYEVVGFATIAFVVVVLIWIFSSKHQDALEHVFDAVKPVTERRVQRPRRTLEPTTMDDIRSAAREFNGRFGESGAAQLATMISQTSKHVVRVQETIECADAEWISTTVRTVHAPISGTVLVPVLRHRKGALVDGLSVEQNGRSVSTLNHIETLGAIAMVLGALFDAAFPSQIGDSTYKSALRNILTAVGGFSVIGSWDKEELEKAVATLDWSEDDRSYEKRAFLDLVRLLEDRFLVIAVIQKCESGERIKVKTKSCVLDPDEDLSWRASLRRSIGLQRRTYRIRITGAEETPSFHFYTKSPEGTYFDAAKLEFGLLVSDDESSSAHVGDIETELKPKIKPSQIFGTDSVHIHIADLGEMSAGRPSLQQIQFTLSTNFREKPPGVVAVQGWMSVYILALTWLAGFNYDRIFSLPFSKSPQGVDLVWSALFFGVPVLVAPWITSRLIMDRIRVISIATYLLLVWLIANSVVTTFLAGIIFVSGAAWSWNIGGQVILNHVAWAVLMVSTATQCGVSCVNLWRKTARLVRARTMSLW